MDERFSVVECPQTVYDNLMGLHPKVNKFIPTLEQEFGEAICNSINAGNERFGIKSICCVGDHGWELNGRKFKTKITIEFSEIK